MFFKTCDFSGKLADFCNKANGNVKIVKSIYVKLVNFVLKFNSNNSKVCIFDCRPIF